VNWGEQILSIYAAPTELALIFYGTAIKILLLRSTFPFVTFVLFCSIQKWPCSGPFYSTHAYTTGGEPDLLTNPLCFAEQLAVLRHASGDPLLFKSLGIRITYFF
jgi:hypothetical protein